MSTAQVSEATALEDGRGSPEGGSRRVYEYSGWVYHLGVNSIGHEYCHLRFLWLRGNYVAMYKRDPHKSRGIKPIRRGFIGHTLMVEELGRRKVNGGDLYVLKFYNRLDESKKGEIACASIGDAHKWMEAFDQAKQQVEYDLSKGDGRNMLVVEDEINFEGHRPRVRRYAHGLRKLIRIGKGPEALLRQSSNLGSNVWTDAYFEDGEDAVESHTWKCVHIVNGIRIFEALGNSKGCKNCLVKAVGVVDASVDAVFEVILSTDKHKRYEWDVLTADLEVVDEVNGHYDVVYGTYDPRYLNRWRAKTDFVFSRQWLRGQDGAYTVLQIPAVHKNCPRKSGYYRQKILPSIWEIRRLNVLEHSSSARCLVTLMLEIRPSWWDRWKKQYRSDFEKTIPFALLNQVAALRDYFRANPSLALDIPTASGHSSISETSTPSPEFDDSDVKDEFYDAFAGNESQDEDSDDEDFEPPKIGSMKLRNVSWAIASLALKRTKVANMELDAGASPITIDLNQFHGSLHKANSENDTNCWASPSGQGFMIRGNTYLSDYSKVKGGDPLLKLIAVDWLKSDKNIDKIAIHPKCLVQSDAAKKLPFILVINLQIPAKPNYSLVLYYASEKPVGKESLLGRFVNGSDMFRDSRFKLIPSIVEGYWMVKRAVGTKACLLGKAVTCRYLRQDNFLEIDVDIGSSSVARSIIGLVLGYVTSIVVDLGILIEAKEEQELPEYILGTVRLNRLKPDDAVQF